MAISRLTGPDVTVVPRVARVPAYSLASVAAILTRLSQIFTRALWSARLLPDVMIRKPPVPLTPASSVSVVVPRPARPPSTPAVASHSPNVAAVFVINGVIIFRPLSNRLTVPAIGGSVIPVSAFVVPARPPNIAIVPPLVDPNLFEPSDLDKVLTVLRVGPRNLVGKRSVRFFVTDLVILVVVARSPFPPFDIFETNDLTKLIVALITLGVRDVVLMVKLVKTPLVLPIVDPKLLPPKVLATLFIVRAVRIVALPSGALRDLQTLTFRFLRSDPKTAIVFLRPLRTALDTPVVALLVPPTVDVSPPKLSLDVPITVNNFDTVLRFLTVVVVVVRLLVGNFRRELCTPLTIRTRAPTSLLVPAKDTLHPLSVLVVLPGGPVTSSRTRSKDAFVRFVPTFEPVTSLTVRDRLLTPHFNVFVIGVVHPNALFTTEIPAPVPSDVVVRIPVKRAELDVVSFTVASVLAMTLEAAVRLLLDVVVRLTTFLTLDSTLRAPYFVTVTHLTVRVDLEVSNPAPVFTLPVPLASPRRLLFAVFETVDIPDTLDLKSILIPIVVVVVFLRVADIVSIVAVMAPRLAPVSPFTPSKLPLTLDALSLALTTIPLLVNYSITSPVVCPYSCFALAFFLKSLTLFLLASPSHLACNTFVLFDRTLPDFPTNSPLRDLALGILRLLGTPHSS